MARRRFLQLVAALCLAYAAIETLYVLRLPLVMDEFQGARAVHRLAELLPYRDFKPYKTVLGYYLQLPALALGAGTWQKMLAVKLQMTAVNTVALGLASVALARRFDRRAVLAGLALLVTMSTFLERSADLRVDMLTALAGLASLLLLIERRHVLAGVACGLGVLVSQKGLYYWLAADAALLACALLARERRVVRELVIFNVAAGVVVAIYLGVWSTVAGPGAVFARAVVDAGRVATDAIADIRLRYWGQTIARNPLFYGLALAALLDLDRRRRAGAASAADRRLLVYGVALLVLAVLHRQPWPYFFVLVVPTLWVLIVALLDGRARQLERLDPSRRRWLVAGLVAAGIVYPLSRLPANLGRDQGFQRHMIELAEVALGPHETYLAGVDLLWQRPQVDDALAWLDRLQLARLDALSPAELAPLVARVEEAPLKLVIDNYRIGQLPPALRSALGRRFAFYWGNLLLYAPILEPGENRFRIAVGGDYRVLADSGTTVEIDGRALEPGSVLHLEAGMHHRTGSERIRLRLLVPELDPLRDPRYRDRRPLFPDVYDY